MALGGRAQTQGDGDDPAVAGLDQPHAGAELGADRRLDQRPLGRGDLVGLVDQDQVSAAGLLLEQLLERDLIVERGIGRALGLDRVEVMGKAPGEDSGGVRDDQDAVER